MNNPQHAAFYVDEGHFLLVGDARYMVQKRETIVNIFNDTAVLLWLKRETDNCPYFLVALQHSDTKEITLTGHLPSHGVVRESDRSFRCNNMLYEVAGNPDVSMWNMEDGYTMAAYECSHIIGGLLLVTEIHGVLEAFDSRTSYSLDSVTFG